MSFSPIIEKTALHPTLLQYTAAYVNIGTCCSLRVYKTLMGLHSKDTFTFNWDTQHLDVVDWEVLLTNIIQYVMLNISFISFNAPSV